MNGTIYKLEDKYVIADEDGRILNCKSSAYRAGQEATTLGMEDRKLCIGSTGLSIIPTSDLELLLGLRASQNGEDESSPSEKSPSPGQSGPGRGGKSGKARGK